MSSPSPSSTPAVCPSCGSAASGRFCSTCGTALAGSTEWRGRGVTTELLVDGTSRIWATFNNTWGDVPSYLLAFDAETGQELTQYRRRVDLNTGGAASGCANPLGVGMGFGGNVLMVAQNTNTVCSLHPTTITANVDTVQVGQRPYTYSDFTGNIYRSFTNPQGKYRILLDSCPGATMGIAGWLDLVLDAELPGAATLEIRFRFGATQFDALNPTGAQTTPTLAAGTIQNGTLSRRTFTIDMAVGSPLLDYVEIEFKLLADSAGLAPKLYNVDVVRSCQRTE